MASDDFTTPTTTDLSHLVPGLLGGESMCATNMVSTRPDYGAPGSESEASADITARDPDPVIPAEADHRRLDHGGGHLPPHPEWSTGR